jgi:hypothetical protein
VVLVLTTLETAIAVEVAAGAQTLMELHQAQVGLERLIKDMLAVMQITMLFQQVPQEAAGALDQLEIMVRERREALVVRE